MAKAYSLSGLLARASTRANKANVPFSLSIDWAQRRWTGHCEITGLPFDLTPQPGRRGPKPYSPSLDRIEPSLGYVPGNCRIILHAINQMKGSGTDDDIRTIATALVESLPYIPSRRLLDTATPIKPTTKPGRPPFGDKALTETEKKRRYRQKKRAARLAQIIAA